MKRSQDLFARVRLEVLVHNVGDHEPGRPGLVGHGRRRRRRDAAQNFLRGPVIDFLREGLYIRPCRRKFQQQRGKEGGDGGRRRPQLQPSNQFRDNA